MIPGYTPNLIDHLPLPAKIQLPPAPSKVWPTYGLAMLRSDESPSYWTSGKAIAVFQIMSKGYGHDHRDKFSISLVTPILRLVTCRSGSVTMAG